MSQVAGMDVHGRVQDHRRQQRPGDPVDRGEEQTDHGGEQHASGTLVGVSETEQHRGDSYRRPEPSQWVRYQVKKPR